MTEKWKTVKFGKILRANKRPYTLGDSEDANLVGMRLYGGGPFHRELKPAMQIAKKTHFVIKSGDVIFNKLFAWKGTFGIVPPELDGMFVSDKFPTYELDQAKVLPSWLKWYFKCPPLWEQAQSMSTGSAALSKLTLNPPKFLLLEIPLPPLSEQRRVVARIEDLSAQIHEARALRAAATLETSRLFFSGCESMLQDCEARCQLKSLNDIVVRDRGISYGVVQTGQAAEVGIPTLRAGDLQWFRCNRNSVKLVEPEVERPYHRTRLRGGELLLRIRGGVGTVAVCPADLIGGNVSREIAVIPLASDVLPEFAMYLLAAPSNQARMAGQVKGTSYVGLNLKDVRNLRVPIPTMSEQRRIVAQLDAFQAEVDALKRLQAETSAELDALLPAILDRAFKGEL
jgi:type I restriction enzyme S subunit